MVKKNLILSNKLKCNIDDIITDEDYKVIEILESYKEKKIIAFGKKINSICGAGIDIGFAFNDLIVGLYGTVFFDSDDEEINYEELTNMISSINGPEDHFYLKGVYFVDDKYWLYTQDQNELTTILYKAIGIYIEEKLL